MGRIRIDSKTAVLVAIVALVLCGAAALLFACGGKGSGKEGQVQPPITSGSASRENCDDIVLQFENAGFTNVSAEGLGDLITGWVNKENTVKEVSVNGKTNYKTSDWFDPNVKVVIRYHSFPEKSSAPKSSSPSGSSVSASASSSDKEAELERVFPVETAKRAAVVALTNATAPDVFASDGNSHDVSRYHSYSDRSGDCLDVQADGLWSYKDDRTWHVSNMKLVNAYGTAMDASLDVSFDGANYLVSNLSGMFGKPGIGTPLESYETYYDDTWCYLTVPPDLLV